MQSFVKVTDEEKDVKTPKIINGYKYYRYISVYPEYKTTGKDVMKKGGSFYAILNSDTNMWSTSEQDMFEYIDKKVLDKISKDSEKQDPSGTPINKLGLALIPELIENSTSKQIDQIYNWFNKVPKDFNFNQLDQDLTFLSDKVEAKDYRSKRLPYDIQNVETPAYTKISTTLYAPEELEKIEWAIGSVFVGDSKINDKVFVLYGDPGTGKSTMLDIIKDLFEGYWAAFNASDLANANSQFSTEMFKDNPLIAIQDDGSLEKIDSPIINEFVSHKHVIINEKRKSKYVIKPNALLMLATNDPVDIHDTKKGISRRLVDIYPSGKKLPINEYKRLIKNVKFELGGIAAHCIEVYKTLGQSYYEDYKPIQMIYKTNHIFNFIFDNYDYFTNNEYVVRDNVYELYKKYFEESGLGYPPKRLTFTEQLKGFYDNYFQVKWIDGKTKRHVYSGFKTKVFEYTFNSDGKDEKKESSDWLTENKLITSDSETSIFDKTYKKSKAQLASDEGFPRVKWDNCKTKLGDVDTSQLHFVKPDNPNHIVIDFDIKDKTGEKNLELNLEAANKWPTTYAELSKSGKGVHLHYIYSGDVSKLSSIFDENIEIKVFSGGASLRRKLSRFFNHDIVEISSGLPVRLDKKMVKDEIIKNEKHLRILIIKNLRKEIHANTTQSINFIKEILDNAYSAGFEYDVSDMKNDIVSFAMSSTHQAAGCLKTVGQMKFKSEVEAEDFEPGEYKEDAPIVVYDVEVYKNLFVVVWKFKGPGYKKAYMINPTNEEISNLFQYRLVGYNNRKYDNHILYARSLGYSNAQLYEISQRIISGDKGAFFGAAYNLSYTDIYDFMSAANKMSLKKWQIKLGIHHQESEWPWDEEVPEDKIQGIAEYCGNDVDSTEAVWDNNESDWIAREILADLSGLTVNDTTNSHTVRIILGDDYKTAKNEFVYTDLSTIFPGYEFNQFGFPEDKYKEGAKIVSGKSYYMGEDPGEGGYVYAEPGIWYNVGLYDIVSMHPHSAIALNVFGKYTKNFEDLVDARVAIKQKMYDMVRDMLEGKLAKYISDESKIKKLPNALKTAINSVYGLTSAKFDNALKDPRNIDNIVAKYGALFMITLKYKVQEMGYTVVHIKTDSIKIVDPTPELEEFLYSFAEKYGYEFDHEATYERMCLVNDAVYIARVGEEEGEIVDPYWTATGAQFQIPYVFKKLFTGEDLIFDDLCETKSVSNAKIYLDMNEGLGEDEHSYRFVGRIGQFVPVKSGYKGGILLREKDGKYSAVTGTKKKRFKKGEEEPVYRWFESETIRDFIFDKVKEMVDFGYFEELIEDAKNNISKYGDFDIFISENLKESNGESYYEEVPFK